MDRQKHNGRITFLDKLILPFGKYGYIIVGMFSGLVGGGFIIDAIKNTHFFSGVIALCFMFIFGYCWGKDTERVKNEKVDNG